MDMKLAEEAEWVEEKTFKAIVERSFIVFSSLILDQWPLEDGGNV